MTPTIHIFFFSTIHHSFFFFFWCPSSSRIGERWTQKGTKNALETGRTFATLLADVDLRHRLLEARTEDEFKRILLKHTQELAEEQSQPSVRCAGDSSGGGGGGTPSRSSHHDTNDTSAAGNNNSSSNSRVNAIRDKLCHFGQGIREDLRRRLPHYISDYKDGLTGVKTPQKVLSTTLFLYFACILPAIAFGVLNDHNTHGKIGSLPSSFSSSSFIILQGSWQNP